MKTNKIAGCRSGRKQPGVLLAGLLSAMFFIMSPLAQADVYNYGGLITQSEGALGVLIPIDSGLGGTITLTSTPGGVSNDPADLTNTLLKITNAVGNTLFCFFYNEACLPLETLVPVVSIDAINLSYADNGCPYAGTIGITTFSNTFQIAIPVSLDITNGTFHAESAGLGSVDGVGSFACDPVFDTDGDGVLDNQDNCTLKANANQRDTNGDGYGNACDPDLDNNGIVNFGDVAQWVPFFNTANNGDQDFNGDGFANFGDYALFPSFFQQPPGPSGIVGAQ